VSRLLTAGTTTLQGKPDALLLHRQQEALSAKILWQTIARELQPRYARRDIVT